MKTRYIFIQSLALALLLITLGCSSKSRLPPVYLNKDLKDYFNYQVGSYWIFYNSVENKTDSVIVGINTIYQPYQSGDNDSYERMTVLLGSPSLSGKFECFATTCNFGFTYDTFYILIMMMQKCLQLGCHF